MGWPALPSESEIDKQMHMIIGDLCGDAYIRKIELKVHIREQHRSNPKPTVEESDGEHKKEINERSTDEENTDVDTLYASPKPPVEEGNDNHEKEIVDIEIKDDNSTQQINSAINSSDAKDDASTEVSETNNDKQE